MRDVFMKGLYIGLLVAGGVTVVLVVGIFFVFGEDTLNVFDFKDQDAVGSGQDDFKGGDFDVGDDGVESDSGEVASSSGGGGGGSSSGDSGDGDEDIGFVCSDWRPVQYSLGNFVDDIECLVYGIDGCEKVKATCGSQVFNLDYATGGIFGIRHSVFLGDEEVSFKVIEENVGPRGRVALRAEMVLDGIFDVGNLKCVVDSERIPEHCVG